MTDKFSQDQRQDDQQYANPASSAREQNVRPGDQPLTVRPRRISEPRPERPSPKPSNEAEQMSQTARRPERQAVEQTGAVRPITRATRETPQQISSTQRLRPLRDPNDPETQRPKPISRVPDETRRQIPIKLDNEPEVVKVTSDTEAPSLNFGRRPNNDKQQVKVSAQNRNAASMAPIFRKEARMTEIPGSRSYPSFLYRISRRGPSKHYRLKGYANKEYVKQRRRHAQKIQNRANMFFWVIIVILFLIFFYWLDPIDRIQELMHLVGM